MGEHRISNYKPIKSKPSSTLQDNSNENILEIVKEERTVALISYPSGNFHELDKKCNSMMEKTPKMNPHGQLLYRCQRCGKEAINSHLKKHIEANHLEGISIPCNFCEKTFRSRDSIGKHYLRVHKSGKLGH